MFEINGSPSITLWIAMKAGMNKNESIWTSVYNHSIILTSNGSKHLVKIEYHSYYVGVNTKRIRSQLTCQECSLEGIMCIACPLAGKKIPTEKLFRIIFLL